MSWVLLLFALTSALLTYNVYRPVHFDHRLAALSFTGGWLTGELALHSIALQALITSLLVVGNAYQGWQGRAGLLLLVGSWLALAADYVRSMRASTVVDRALAAGLGPGYLEGIQDDQKAKFAGGTRWRSILHPLRIRLPEVERLQDVCYATIRNVDLRLDVYRHRSHPAQSPTLVQIHGGAWVIGTKDHQALPLMNHMAARGWTCISVGYRLSPAATFPEHLMDVKLALRWIRENGQRYGANPNFIVVTGGSAGGHLAALVALTANEPEFQTGFEEVDTSVRGCVSFYGVYDFTNRHGQLRHQGLPRVLERWVMKSSLEEIPDEYRKASPVDWVHSEAPPFFVIHGERDTLAPAEDARLFVNAFREKASAPIVYAEIPGAQHAFDLCHTPRSQAAIDGVERFLACLYSRYLASLEAIEEPKAAVSGIAAGTRAGTAPSPRVAVNTSAEP